MRAGAHALSLLSDPLDVQVLTALDGDTTPLAELRRAVGSPPQTTTRVHLRRLTEIGVLERRAHGGFPGGVDYELGRPGRELMEVVEAVDAWLQRSPRGPVSLGTMSATSAIKALTGGWSCAIVRALAARPLSLTDLNRLIPGVNYPTLERRLSEMRLAGMIESCQGRNRSRPYSVTGWLRRALGPLAAAAFWERRNLPTEAPSITPLDIEAAFLLAVPALHLDPDQSGICRMAVGIRDNGDERLVGVRATVDEGRVASCVSKLGGPADAWVSGSALEWIRAVLDGQATRLEIGGECCLAVALVEGLHETLVRVREPACR